MDNNDLKLGCHNFLSNDFRFINSCNHIEISLIYKTNI